MIFLFQWGLPCFSSITTFPKTNTGKLNVFYLGGGVNVRDRPLTLYEGRLKMNYDDFTAENAEHMIFI